MKYKLIHSAFLLFILCCNCSLPKNAATSDNVLQASSLFPFGRYAWNEKQDLELISSAINFGFSFSGKECKVFAYLTDTAAHNYLQYELDLSLIHISEPTRLLSISYAVFCLKKKK